MRRIRRGSKALIREINQAIVLDKVRTDGMASRSEIAAFTGLSPATVSGITAELVEYGLLRESAIGESAGGRRPVLLELVGSAGHAIGVKVTESAVLVVLTDLNAEVVDRRLMQLDHHSVQDVVEAIVVAVAELTADAATHPVHGLGVGVAGVVDSRNGVVHHATYHDWRDVPLARLLEERIDMAVIIDNDVNALTAHEQLFGAGRDVSNLLVISLGRGVGLGMVLDGELYRGVRGGAGEFGHVKLALAGRVCACGQDGCLEAMVSNPALAMQVSERLGRDVGILEAGEIARAGDVEAIDVFASAARLLGVAVANLVNLLNPELVVISGEGAWVLDITSPAFEDTLDSHCFDGLRDDFDVVVETWDDEAWACGAASLLLGQLFQPSYRGQELRRASFTGG